jgi:hypothetical protein
MKAIASSPHQNCHMEGYTFLLVLFVIGLIPFIEIKERKH